MRTDERFDCTEEFKGVESCHDWCQFFRKDDIRLESVKALRAVANADDPMEKTERKGKAVLPDFVSMINFVQEKVMGLQDCQ